MRVFVVHRPERLHHHVLPPVELPLQLLARDSLYRHRPLLSFALRTAWRRTPPARPPRRPSPRPGNRPSNASRRRRAFSSKPRNGRARWSPYPPRTRPGRVDQPEPAARHQERSVLVGGYPCWILHGPAPFVVCALVVDATKHKIAGNGCACNYISV